MPAQEIPRSYRNVGGYIAHRGKSVHFESPLERDFYRLLRFDEDVVEIHAQPLKIPFGRPDGTTDHCYPDALVIFKPLSGKRTTLYEVKTRDDLSTNWKELKPKLKAARRRASMEGWKYKIVSEVEIRTPFLHNVNFLQDYRDREVDQLGCQRMLRAVRGPKEWTVDSLLESMVDELRVPRVELLPLVWHLIATRQIKIDLSVPLNTRLPISQSL